MGTLRNVTRRGFLIGSAAVMGGVAFGAYMINRPHANPLETAEGEASFNPWVLISPEKVTLISPHGDKGQGVMSTQAMLIAEEMDLAWGGFEVSFGAPSPAYWNHAMADDGVPFASTDRSMGAEAARAATASIFKLLGMQLTGGSTSSPDGFVKLREAGAMARETLKLAASKRYGTAVADLSTKDSAVILPDGTAVPYTELAGEAAGLSPVTGTPLRDPSTWTLIGTPQQRLDIPAKSTGTQTYGIDVQRDGMVYATVKRNPRKGGPLKGYDASEAEGMRGVQKIVPLDGGVAVVADNTWRAIQAAEAITFDWGPAPYPAEQADHWAALEGSFTESKMDREWRNEGDILGAIAQGEAIEAEYRSPYVAHAPLEPLNAVVHVTDAGVEVWSGHQVPGFLVQKVAETAGVPQDQVTYHNLFMGGSFGHRLEFEHVIQATQVAMAMKGTPVKLTYSREEDFAHDFPRHIAMGRGKGLVKDGKVVGMDLAIASPSVIDSQMGRLGIAGAGPDTQIAAGAWNVPYTFDHFRMCAFRAAPLSPVSSWRAVGAPGAGFILDSFLDELIHAAGADPLEERLRLTNNPVARKVLETAGEMASWGGELAPGKGRGVAFVESFGVPVAEIVEVTNDEGAIKIDKVWVAADVGTVLDPVNFENLVQGGVVFGLGHAINSEITYADGMAEQANYYDAEGMRLYQCPEIFVKGLENGDRIRGIGEPPVPPAAPALGNAIFAATGQRLREMPFYHHIDFV